MCLHVERAHLIELRSNALKALNDLKAAAAYRGQKDFFLHLSGATAEAAIVFRDFPKRHGLIIQKAVGLALLGHAGGYVETSKRFSFLSGMKVEIDNFFVHSSGQIYLIETKRDYDSTQKDGYTGRSLYDAASHIEQHIRKTTGRALRHPIICAFFSYIHAEFKYPKHARVNIGTKSHPDMKRPQVFSRADMNALIGPCFGIFIEQVDDLVAQVARELMPDLVLQTDLLLSRNPLLSAAKDTGRDTGELLTVGGEAEERISDVETILGAYLDEVE